MSTLGSTSSSQEVNENPHLSLWRRIDINNVGSISQALYAHGNPDYDEVESAQIQSLQVSTVSIMNCVGRIIIGQSLLPPCTQADNNG